MYNYLVYYFGNVAILHIITTESSVKDPENV